MKGSAKRNQIPSRLPVGRLVHSPASLPRRVVKDCTPPGAHAPTSPPNALHAMILFTPDTPDDDLYLSLYVSSYRAVVRAVVRVVALAIALVVVVGLSIRFRFLCLSHFIAFRGFSSPCFLFSFAIHLPRHPVLDHTHTHFSLYSYLTSPVSDSHQSLLLRSLPSRTAIFKPKPDSPPRTPSQPPRRAVVRCGGGIRSPCSRVLSPAEPRAEPRSTARQRQRSPDISEATPPLTHTHPHHTYNTHTTRRERKATVGHRSARRSARRPARHPARSSCSSRPCARKDSP